MTSTLIHSTGTVTVTNGSAAVAGAGTAWAINLVTGGMISCRGLSIPIASVEGDEALTLAYPWPSTTEAGQAYAIAREWSHAADVVWANDRLARIIATLALSGVHPDGAGTLAERNALNPAPAPGYLWLRVENGAGLAIYKRTGGGWDGPYSFKGDPGIGAGGYGLPAGGTDGQLLVKDGATNGATRFETLDSVLAAANPVKDLAVSLLPDSGRFAGDAAKGQTVSAFAFPSYLTLYNGSTSAAAGKFVTDNTDYGGSAGALPTYIRHLIDQIRDPAYRRHGVEFYAAQITMGAGTATSPILIGGVNHYYSAFLTFGPRAPSMTFHIYLRALDAPIAYRCYPGQTMVRNGIESTDHVVIAPADGWVSVTVRDEQDPYLSNGYNPTPFNIYAASAGHRYLIACPALMGGITGVDDNIGIIAGINRWLP